MTEARQDRAGALAGTFLICCALLAFEVSSLRTINFAIGPSYIFVAISLAMLGLTAAGSLMSRFDLQAVRLPTAAVLAVACALIAVLILGVHVYIAAAKDVINAEIRAAGLAGGNERIFQYLLVQGPLQAARVGLALTLPYFLFGALLSFLFARARSGDYAPLYAADLFGAAFGCVAIVILMETTGYAVSVTAPALCALLAACAYAWPLSRRAALAGLLVTGLAGMVSTTQGWRDLVEPGADPNYLVRDYAMTTDQVERWTGWNSFTRVAAIERAEWPDRFAVLSLANGDGMAFLLPFEPEAAEPVVHTPVIPALITGPAQSALVIFAGAGADLLSLRAHGIERVVGVELNGRLVEAGHALTAYDLDGFLAQDGVDLHVEEARAFLERDEERFDIVLVSWSGATLVYRMGALGGTTDYVFTYEGLSAVLDSLSPEGRAVILQVNKLDMIAGLRRYLAERGIAGDPAQTVIVLYKEGLNHSWNAPWDDNPMLVRPGGWQPEEVDAILRRAEAQGFAMAYAPGRPTPATFSAYERVLTATDPEAEIAAISREENRRFGVARDDRPFHLDHFSPARYLRAEFWAMVADSRDRPEDVFHYFRVMLTLVIAVAAFLLALLPLAYAGRRVQSRRRAASYMGYFMLLGAGFMFIEIGLIHRTAILLGNPGLTVAVVLCAVILSTGLGSLISNRAFAAGLTIRAASLGVVAYALLAALLAPALVSALMAAGLAVKIAAIALIIAPGGILMGQLFPQGLVRAQAEDRTLVPWAWAINGAMSATVAGLAPLVAQVTGFAALFVIGAALYAAVPLLAVGRGASGETVPAE